MTPFKNLKKIGIVFLAIALAMPAYSAFAFDQAYFDQLPEKDKQTINLVTSVNSSVVSVTGKKKVAKGDVRCFVIFNGICITA